jgi:ATP-binding cassette subfamily G (WHITE) protein 1
MVGLDNHVDKYFILVVVIMLCSLCGFALGVFFASVFPSLPVALMVTSIAVMPLMLFSGLFVNQGSIPNYLDWMKYLSPMKYGFEALVKNEFRGLTIIGPNDRPLDGQTVINLLGLGRASEYALLFFTPDYDWNGFGFDGYCILCIEKNYG